MPSVHTSPLPEQSPPQPLNCESGPGVATSVTVVPGWNDAPQVTGGAPAPMAHGTPGGIVTLPSPLARLWRFTASNRGPRKIACVALCSVTTNVQGPVPAQGEPGPGTQPRKIESGAGVAVSVTVVPDWNEPVHGGAGTPGATAQIVPDGWTCTVPEPF